MKQSKNIASEWRGCFRQSGPGELFDGETLNQKPVKGCVWWCTGKHVYLTERKAWGDGTRLVGSRKSTMTSGARVDGAGRK